MKTTIELPDDLFRRAAARAAMEGLRLQDLIVRGLELALEEPRCEEGRTVFPLLRSERSGSLTVEQVSCALAAMDDEDAQCSPFSVDASRTEGAVASKAGR